jgi:NAD(P)-dependent dehydrogenase (short-subunit alcohol dehydrogenase family)
MEESNLAGKTALVTGSGRGMGLAIALTLARRGANIVINDLSEDLVSAGMSEIEPLTSAIGVAADVTDLEQVNSMVGAATSRFGGVDIAVNNAGILRPTPFVDISEREWTAVMDVTVHGTFLVSQAVLRGMIDRKWGRIINISSTAGKSVSTIGGAHYTTAKTAVLGLTRAVAKEVAADGVTVNAICPGLFDTDMTRTTIPADTAAAYAASFPIPRLGLPSEVADLVAFLASDQAAYITGAALDINGGDLML